MEVCHENIFCSEGYFEFFLVVMGADFLKPARQFSVNVVFDKALGRQLPRLQRTDTAREWAGPSAANDLQSDAGTASLSQRHLRTDGPARCRYDINLPVRGASD
jgi:hypothetical protein